MHALSVYHPQSKRAYTRSQIRKMAQLYKRRCQRQGIRPLIETIDDITPKLMNTVVWAAQQERVALRNAQNNPSRPRPGG